MMIHNGECREVMRRLISEGIKVQSCVTSPPYWGLRDYGCSGQMGLEETPEEYVANMVEVFSLVYELLADDGTLWLNLGDSYAGSGRGQTANGCADPKNPKTQGMKLPVHRPSNQSSSTLTGSTDTQANALRVSDNCKFPGLKPKDMVGIPWRVAFALQAAGWYLRCDIIWSKPNPMPESVTDRPTKAHEYIFLFSKKQHYYYDHEAIKEPGVWDLDGSGTLARKDRARDDQKSAPTEMKNGIRGSVFKDAKKFNGKNSDKQRGHSRRHAGFNDRWDAMDKEEQCSGMRNKRSVWEVVPFNYKEAHFATYPPKLIEPCILAGSRPKDIILDPFNGSGTTGMVAYQHGREYIGIELNPAYIEMAEKRMSNVQVDMLTSLATPSLDAQHPYQHENTPSPALIHHDDPLLRPLLDGHAPE